MVIFWSLYSGLVFTIYFCPTENFLSCLYQIMTKKDEKKTCTLCRPGIISEAIHQFSVQMMKCTSRHLPETTANYELSSKVTIICAFSAWTSLTPCISPFWQQRLERKYFMCPVFILSLRNKIQSWAQDTLNICRNSIQKEKILFLVYNHYVNWKTKLCHVIMNLLK